MSHPFINRLFPVDSSYEGIADVETIRALQNRSLIQAGLGTMGAGARGAPLGQALAEGVGPAIAEFPRTLQAATESAMRLKSFKDIRDMRANRKTIVESNPRLASESLTDWLRRLYPLFLRSGDDEIVSRLTELLKSAGSGDFTYREGVDEAGQPGVFRIPDEAGAAAERVPGMSPDAGVSPAQQAIEQQRRFTRENMLTDDYDRNVRPWLVPYGSLERALAHKDRALQGDGGAQIEVLYSFINTLDNSVVREGEVGLASRAVPIIDRGKQFLAKYARNRAAVVPPDLLNDMVELLDDTANRFANRFDKWRTHYQKRARRWNVDPESFIDLPDVFGGTGRPAQLTPRPRGRP